MSEQIMMSGGAAPDVTGFLLDRLDDLVAAVDEHGDVVYASAGWHAEFGRDDEARRSVFEMITPSDHAVFRRCVELVAEQCGTLMSQTLRLMAGASPRAYTASLSAARQGESRFTMVSLVSHRDRWDDAGGALVRAWVPMLERLCDHAAAGTDQLIVVRVAPDLIHELATVAGGAAHDEVLSTLVRRLRAELGPCHAIGQAGSDDVMIVRWAVDPDGLGSATERLCEAVNAATQEPIEVDGQVFVPRAHCGIAVGNGVTSAVDLVRDATMALRNARSTGRRWQVHETVLTNGLSLLQTCLLVDGAVQNGEVDVAFQPVHDTATGQVVGVEALARFSGALAEYDVGGVIADAESTGSIVALGRQVAERALGAVSGWTDWSGYLALNVSPVQLNEPRFAGSLMRLLDDYGFAADRLVLEVTESAIVDDARAVDTLDQLRASGVRVAIDDFGTGQSSISRLHQLPIDILKVDREFVRRLDERGAAAIVRTIAALARALDVDVVAEGVEQLRQFDELRRLGIGHIQGFLFGRPALDYRPPAMRCDAADPSERARPDCSQHEVCFRSWNDHTAVVDFVVEGLERGERVTCIVEDGRVDAVRREIGARWPEASTVERCGGLVLVPCGEMLRRCSSDGGAIDIVRCRSAIADLLQPDDRWPGQRVYGEAVGVLWSMGQVTALIELEQAWCDAVRQADAAVLCGYPTDLFASPSAFAIVRSFHDDACGGSRDRQGASSPSQVR